MLVQSTPITPARPGLVTLLVAAFPKFNNYLKINLRFSSLDV